MMLCTVICTDVRTHIPVRNTATLSGYGPIASKLNFDEDITKYELREIKFVSFLRLQKLVSVRK